MMTTPSTPRSSRQQNRGRSSTGRRGASSLSNSRSRSRSSGRGVAYRGQTRDIVNSVREYFEFERANGRPILTVDHVIERTVESTGVSRASVYRFQKEKDYLQSGNPDSFADSRTQLSTPGKKRPNASLRVTKLDSFQEEAIKNHIYGYYTRGERPTLKRLLVSLHEAELLQASSYSLRQVLRRIGFKFTKIDGRKLLMERGDIVSWRCRFLREILNPSVNFEDIVWLDETWVNAGHFTNTGWSDRTLEATKPTPSGKGGRLILLHAGTSHGFIPGALDLFRSKKTGDYHEEMNHEHSKQWFQHQLMDNLERRTVIVMDNAPYHSKVIDPAPTNRHRKHEIAEWLTNHDNQFDFELRKPELLDLVKQHKPARPRYEIDELAEQRGHRVIRLPPYHCHFNPIEMIWSHIKQYVGDNNKKFTVSEVERLTREGINKVTADQWSRDVAHVKKIIREAWETDGLVEDAIDQFIVHVADDDSDNSYGSDNESETDSNDW